MQESGRTTDRHFLNLGTRWWWWSIHASAAWALGTVPLLLIEQEEAGCVPEPVWMNCARGEKDKQYTYNHNTEERSCNNCCRGKSGSIRYSELCVCNLKSSSILAPYCYLWPIWLYHNFPHYHINDTISRMNLMSIKSVFWVSLQLFSETIHILRRIRNNIYHKCT
jgi:hypothetical protein